MNAVQEALAQLPLPPGWTCHRHSTRLPDGTTLTRRLFVDHETQTTTWSDPRLEQIFPCSILDSMPPDWEVDLDAEGEPYFSNHATQHTCRRPHWLTEQHHNDLNKFYLHFFVHSVTHATKLPDLVEEDLEVEVEDIDQMDSHTIDIDTITESLEQTYGKHTDTGSVSEPRQARSTWARLNPFAWHDVPVTEHIDHDPTLRTPRAHRPPSLDSMLIPLPNIVDSSVSSMPSSSDISPVRRRATDIDASSDSGMSDVDAYSNESGSPSSTVSNGSIHRYKSTSRDSPYVGSTVSGTPSSLSPSPSVWSMSSLSTLVSSTFSALWSTSTTAQEPSLHEDAEPIYGAQGKHDRHHVVVNM
eukprot:m.4575 g.4575  ORF g.4575 m.4575 type:complete len:357 (+) comp4519_c0_seq2:653-1723(+)